MLGVLFHFMPFMGMKLDVPVTRATLPERSKSDCLVRLCVLAMLIVNCQIVPITD